MMEFTVRFFAHLAATLLWLLLLGALVLGLCVALHANGVFTCDTIWCS